MTRMMWLAAACLTGLAIGCFGTTPEPTINPNADPAAEAVPVVDASEEPTGNLVAEADPGPDVDLTSWQTIVVSHAFTFRAPAELEPVPTRGIDSLVGRYAGAGFEVSFDYGWYSNPLDGDEYAHRWVVVGGRDARLATRPGSSGSSSRPSATRN